MAAQLLPGFKFVAVWEWATVSKQLEQFIKFGHDTLHARIQFLEEVYVSGWDGRTDVIFAVHQSDIWPFVHARARRDDMFFVEEVLDRHPAWYPEHLQQYRRY